MQGGALPHYLAVKELSETKNVPRFFDFIQLQHSLATCSPDMASRNFFVDFKAKFLYEKLRAIVVLKTAVCQKIEESTRTLS